MRDPDRRYRNEPERVEVEEHDDLATHARGEQSWMPESNSGRAALAATVRAWRKTDGAGQVAAGGQDQVVRALESQAAGLDGRSRQAAAAAGLGDLGGVRVHTDSHAAEAASAIGARAFTVGSDVFFGAGEYAPGTAEGDQLIGHELTHVAQQRGAEAPQVQTKLEVSRAGDSMEVEADQAGDVFARAAQGHQVAPAEVHSTGSMAIAREELTHSPRRAEPEVAPAVAQATTELLTERQVASAIRFNRGKNHPDEVWSQIAGVVGSASTALDAGLVQAVARFQSAQGFTVDGAVGDMTMQRLSQTPGGEGLDRHVRSDAIVFVGLNPSSRGVELATLQNAAGAGNVTGVTGARQQDTARAGNQTVDLNDESGLDAFVAQFDGMDAGRRQALRDFLQDTGSRGKDEMAQLATILYQAEMGKRLIKRMVLSGHSSGDSLWGDDNASLSFGQLSVLKGFFPMAMGQVEDLMLSACNTGFQDLIPQYLAIFPNLRAIWAYEGYSPSAATGSTRHIREWEKASRGNASHEAMDAGRQRVAAGSGKRDQNVAVWTREQGAATSSFSSQSGYQSGGYDELKAEVDGLMHHYDMAYVMGAIDAANLSELYTKLQALLGTYSAELGDQRALYVTIMKHVLYLRHWNNITRNFMREHGNAVRESYRAAGAPVPAFAGMNRTEVLAQVNNFPGDRSSEGYELLTGLLVELDPARIPDNWN
jgi:hypothetical protein